MNKQRKKEWVRHFKSIAEVIKEKSKDESTQIGAVVADDDGVILSTGYNSFPRNVRDNIEIRQERPLKYAWMEHAERNSIYNAARKGISLKGSVMYLTCGIPCTDCARGIINSGIKEIYCVKGDSISHGLKGNHWDDNIKQSKKMLLESNVKISYYEDIL